ncbi:MAG: PspC domain-containing protein [Anaerolineae bacterium]|jgi:phage shock protein PspC (stress-responsive transcriptional regulator)|nr:PspC domain-containing protein [Anaerolineae bacterium]
MRSFTDRVLGGICGGIGTQLRVNPWLIRLIFSLLTIASVGFGVIVYLALWWAIPQQSPTLRPKGSWGALIMTVLLIGILTGLWLTRDTLLQLSSGQSLFLPLVALMLSLIFLFRQVRA